MAGVPLGDRVRRQGIGLRRPAARAILGVRVRARRGRDRVDVHGGVQRTLLPRRVRRTPPAGSGRWRGTLPRGAPSRVAIRRAGSAARSGRYRARRRTRARGRARVGGDTRISQPVGASDPVARLECSARPVRDHAGRRRAARRGATVARSRSSRSDEPSRAAQTVPPRDAQRPRAVVPPGDRSRTERLAPRIRRRHPRHRGHPSDHGAGNVVELDGLASRDRTRGGHPDRDAAHRRRDRRRHHSATVLGRHAPRRGRLRDGRAVRRLRRARPRARLRQSVETLSTVVFVLVLRRLPDRFERQSSPRRRVLRIAIAAASSAQWCSCSRSLRPGSTTTTDWSPRDGGSRRTRR